MTDEMKHQKDDCGSAQSARVPLDEPLPTRRTAAQKARILANLVVQLAAVVNEQERAGNADA